MKTKNIFKINSQYRPEIVIPLSAIEKNANFILLKDDGDRKVITQDGKISPVKARRTINILSKEGQELVKNIYGITDIGRFLTKWYAQTKGTLYSLEFQYLTLGKPEEYKE